MLCLVALLGGGAAPDGGGVPPADAPTLPPAAIAALQAQARTGDLVFRAGRGWRADAVRATSLSGWTHVGIIDMDARGRVFVIHAAPPEDGHGGRVVRESVARFAAPAEAERIAVQRLAVPDATLVRMVRAARGFAARQVPFDDAFDLADARALYCTELVWRSLWRAGVQVRPRTRAVPVPLMRGRYMTPDDLRAMLPLRPVLSDVVS